MPRPLCVQCGLLEAQDDNRQWCTLCTLRGSPKEEEEKARETDDEAPGIGDS